MTICCALTNAGDVSLTHVLTYLHQLRVREPIAEGTCRDGHLPIYPRRR